MIISILGEIQKEIALALCSIDEKKADEVVDNIIRAPSVFLAGVGRSGYMMRAFAMRLMQEGINAHMIGDTYTSAAKAGDLMIIGSGSGETESLKSNVVKARQLGLKVILVTSISISALGAMSDIVLQISAPTPKSEKCINVNSIQPMGSLFEQCLLICMDAIVFEIMDKKGLSEKTMFERHANIE